MTEAERADSSDETDEPGLQAFIFDLVSSAGAVLLVAGLLFAISGVWPPLVAIESGSMEPNIQTNDLVFVMDDDRFAGPGSHSGTGIVTARMGAETGYTSFEKPGDVIVYAPDGDSDRTPIIHRAMFWVNESENWYEKANPDYVGGADNCEELAACPATSNGFMTKGDNNQNYDQVGLDPLSSPVRPGWVAGTAEARVPWLGNIRLRLGAAVQGTDSVAMSTNNSTGPEAATNSGGSSRVEPTMASYTVSYNFVSDFATTGWRNCSRDYSR